MSNEVPRSKVELPAGKLVLDHEEILFFTEALRTGFREIEEAIDGLVDSDSELKMNIDEDVVGLK